MGCEQGGTWGWRCGRFHPSVARVKRRMAHQRCRGGGRRQRGDQAAPREDTALALLLGHGLPAPPTARDLLDAFDEAAPPLWQGERCHVQGEGEQLQVLAKAGRRLLGFRGRALRDRHQPPRSRGRQRPRPDPLAAQQGGGNSPCPRSLHDARPKRLRFVLLDGVGKVMRHARELMLRRVGEGRPGAGGADGDGRPSPVGPARPHPIRRRGRGRDQMSRWRFRAGRGSRPWSIATEMPSTREALERLPSTPPIG